MALAAAALATLVVAAATIGAIPVEALAAAALLAGFALATERIDVQFGALAVTGGFLPAVAICVIAPGLAPFLGLAAAVGSYPTMRSRISNVATSVLACSTGAAAAQALGAPQADLTGIVSAACVATIAFVTVNSLLIGTCLVLARAGEPRELVLQLTASLVANSAFFAPVVGAICAAIVTMGPWVIPALLIPLAVAQYFVSLYHRKVQLTDELAEKAQMLARTNLQFAAAMVRALDMRDAYTAGHSAAVAVYTRDIAREMGFDDETVRLAHLAGLLHDIGKIGVPGRVLNKTAPLDDEEYELMKSHAAMGASILGDVDLYADIALIVRYHHERIDGRGYPDGIAGEAIPAVSRMISVADTYSAMTTDRPYREGMPTEKAMSILRECRGTQLDQDFTDAFLRILIVADETYQRGKQTDFDVEVAKHQALSEVEAEAVRIDAPVPVGPEAPDMPMLPAAVDGELVEVELEREAA